MLCIVTFEGGQPTGWIIATDADDARRQAHGAGRTDLAGMLYRMPNTLAPGRHQISHDTWVLVS